METQPAILDAPTDLLWFFAPLNGGRVIEVNLYAAYKAGSRAQKLLSITADAKRGDVGLLLIDACHWISTFQLEARHVKLERTMQAAETLKKGLLLIVETTKAENMEEPLGDDWLEAIRSLYQKFEEAFRVEAGRANIYAITSKGIYDTRKLMEAADEKFSENVRKLLSEQTVYDLREVGKCLAVESPTAAVFHMLRGTEAFMLKYCSRTHTAQVNEALCKVLCHNLCCVIQSVHELGIEANFEAEQAVSA